MEIHSDERALIEALMDSASESPASSSLDRLARWREAVPPQSASVQADNCNAPARVADGQSGNGHSSNCNTPQS